MGIEEDKKMEKSWDDTEKIVSDVICKKLRIQETLHMESAHRVGKQMSDPHDGSKQKALKHGPHTRRIRIVSHNAPDKVILPRLFQTLRHFQVAPV